MRVVFSLLTTIFAASFAAGANAQEIDWKKVDEALGKTAAVSGDVHRYGLPRTDLNVTLDGVTIIGRKTLELMASNHLGSGVKIDSPLLPTGHGFGLGFAVRTHQGMAPFAGSVGQFFWSGIAGTFFWIDPQEELFAVFMSQGPGQREYFRTLVRSLVYAAVE